MRFLYNFFGRGFFNIYVGIMPLSLLRDEQNSNFQILVIVSVCLMCFIGVMYILAKVLCCAQEDIDLKKRKNSDESDDSDS